MNISLNQMHIDILKELGNIGAGNATTALSKMLNKTINMGVPEVKVHNITDVPKILGGEENSIAGILLKVDGDIKGIMMYILEYESVCKLLSLLLNKEIKTNEQLIDIDMSALKEIGNILTGSYLTALSKLTNLNMFPSTPKLSLDMAGAILSVPAVYFGIHGDSVLLIQTDFYEGDNEVTGYYILIPEEESFEHIMKSLGVV